MAGIYLHIPFCKTRCIYCDFYSTTRSDLKPRYIQALCQELRSRKDYLKGETVHTVYFGGGTPSQLAQDDFERVFQTIDEVYGLSACTEITLEANPDDLTTAYVGMLATLPFNRISMGIQTFDDATLRLLNRRHTARQAIDAVRCCRDAGFGNLSIDLIYGLPGETDHLWEHDLDQAIGLGVEHISAYHLTYEQGTPLYDLLRGHHVCEVDEESSLRFFRRLTERLEAAGYVHYEISNFCRSGMEARHNAAYWHGVPYLGCGPSAHSFDRQTREWNTASLAQYLHALEHGTRAYETEGLDLTTRYNEYVMTGLRTRQGISTETLARQFGPDLSRYCLKLAAPHLEAGRLSLRDGRLSLTRAGIFVSDDILSDLMFVED